MNRKNEEIFMDIHFPFCDFVYYRSTPGICKWYWGVLLDIYVFNSVFINLSIFKKWEGLC